MATFKAFRIVSDKGIHGSVVDATLDELSAGDVVIVQPGASVRRGDRVVVRTRAGEVMAKVLGRRNEQIVELLSLNPAHATRQIATADIDWIARIVWASQ